MAILVQNLAGIVNVLEDTKPAGEQILYTLSKTCVAKPIHRDPNPDTVQFMDDEGMPTASVILDGTVQFQDIAGSPTLWAGTIDAFVDKMNNEYFIEASGGGSLPIGAATEAKQDAQIVEETAIKVAVESIDTNGAKEAKQDTANTSLSSIDGKLTGSTISWTHLRPTDATGSPIAAGSKHVSIRNSGGADGVLQGVALKAGEVATFPNTGNDTNGAITFDATGTEFFIQIGV